MSADVAENRVVSDPSKCLKNTSALDNVVPFAEETQTLRRANQMPGLIVVVAIPVSNTNLAAKIS